MSDGDGDIEFAIYFLILKQTYQLENKFLNRSASGWDDLQQDISIRAFVL